MKRLFSATILAALFLYKAPLTGLLWCDPCAREYHNQCGVYFGSNTLYWTACQSCLVPNSTITEEEGKITIDFDKLEYDWEFGYRLYAGYHPGMQGFDIGLFYTYYSSDASNSRKVTDIVMSTEVERRIKVKNDLRYNVVDLLLSREHFLCTPSIVRPFFGFRALWIDQDYINKRSNLNNKGKESDQVQKQYADLDLSAVGAHLGMEYLMDLCGGFSLNLTLAGSLLEGKMDHLIKQFSDETDQLSPDPLVVKTKVKEDHCMPIPGYQMAAGITWESTLFDCGWYRFDLNYELNQWFHISTFEPKLFQGPLTACTNKSTLLLHGLTLRSLYFF